MKLFKSLFLILLLTWGFAFASPIAMVEEWISHEEDLPVVETLSDKYVDALSSVVDKPLAKHIVDRCSEFDDQVLCIKNIIGISSAESSIFTRVGTHNNGFWIMKRGWDWSYSVRKFQSLQEGVDYFIYLYWKNKRYKRTTAKAWLNGGYCASACTHWEKNYYWAIKKIGL